MCRDVPRPDPILRPRSTRRVKGAARFLALATMDSALCTESMPEHYPVKIVEVMGRDAGWLAAATALGSRSLPPTR